MKEIWKPLKYKNVKDMYIISNTGKIKNIKSNKYIKGSLSHNGYVRIKLQNNDGSARYHPLHRLVLLHFGLFKKLNKPTVNHKDGNKLNNSITNLEWNDYSEQQLHSVKIGLRGVGEHHVNNKYSEQFIHSICKLIEKGYKPKEMCNILNIPYSRSIKSLVKNIRLKYTWKHISKYYDI